jgi:hypothetical protein
VRDSVGQSGYVVSEDFEFERPRTNLNQLAVRENSHVLIVQSEPCPDLANQLSSRAFTDRFGLFRRQLYIASSSLNLIRKTQSALTTISYLIE